MIVKCFEIRDDCTCMAMVGIKMESADRTEAKFLRRAGYPPDGSMVVLMNLSDQKAACDPHAFGGRTWPAAHRFITDHFDALPNGTVIDVRVILGESTTPAPAEIGRTM